MALSRIQNNSYEDTAVHGVRNLIINGAMQVAQRGTSGATGNGYNSVDRFRIASGGTSQWALTQTQETDAPTGFSKSTKYSCVTAETTLDAADWAGIQYTFEGQDLQHLSYGSASAQSITLSFWVKSSATGTFGVSLFQPNDSRIIGSTYTISSANTWEQKIITFAGDTTGIIDNVNTEGLRIYWLLAAGSSYTGIDNTSWKAYAGNDFADGHVVNLIDSTSDNFYLTGVQLEVGDTATPFEHRSFGDELARCQRYYYEYSGANSDWLGLGNVYQTDQVICPVYSPTVMRALPTLTKTLDGSSEWLTTYDGFTGTNSNASTSLNSKGTSTIASSYIYITGTGRSGSDGQCHWLTIKTGAALHFDAEL